MRRDDDADRFIAGIHNYCDRWCERCRFTDRCRVFATEQKRLEEHLLRGEDPDDPEVFMRDMAESFQETMEMLQEMADETGMDLEEIAEAPEEPEPQRRRRERDHPLCQRAQRWGERVQALLERMRTDLPGIGVELARQGEEMTEREQDGVLHGLEALRDAYELLAQYRLLIVVKMARATSSDDLAEDADDEELAGYRNNDALGTARLVHECLGKAATALWCVAEFDRPWQGEGLPLAAEAESLRQAIDAGFPGHRKFRRPGLDDPLDP